MVLANTPLSPAPARPSAATAASENRYSVAAGCRAVAQLDAPQFENHILGGIGGRDRTRRNADAAAKEKAV